MKWAATTLALKRPGGQSNAGDFPPVLLDRLRQTGDLVDLHQPVDIRHIATLVDPAETALYFHNVIGYEMPVVSGIIRSRERAMMALGCETYREIEDRLKAAIDRPDFRRKRQELADPRGGVSATI